MLANLALVRVGDSLSDSSDFLTISGIRLWLCQIARYRFDTYAAIPILPGNVEQAESDIHGLFGAHGCARLVGYGIHHVIGMILKFVPFIV